MAEKIKKEELKETKLKELQLSDEDLDNVPGGLAPLPRLKNTDDPLPNGYRPI